jgi:hypothetical protein
LAWAHAFGKRALRGAFLTFHSPGYSDIRHLLFLPLQSEIISNDSEIVSNDSELVSNDSEFISSDSGNSACQTDNIGS